MAKQYKIKRSYGSSGTTYRAKPHPVAVVLTVVGVVALVYLGALLYEPFTNFIMGNYNSTPPVVEPLPEPEEASGISQEPEPEPEPLPTAYGVRAVFLPQATALDAAATDAFLDTLAGSDINTVLVDIKDAAGSVLFNTQNAQAAGLGAILAAPLDLSGLAEKLEARGLGLAVRMHAFRDPLAARADRDIAIRYRDTDWLWLDADNNPWLNPYSEGAREYIASLAMEAVDMGARLVVMDSVQFPVNSEANATFGAQAAGVARPDILRSFMDTLNSELQVQQARAATYITATSMTQEYENQTRYGGSPLAAAGQYVVLGALPYQFGTGFTYGNQSVEQPVAQPGQAVAAALAIFLDEHPLAGDNPDYIVFLQGGNEPEINTETAYTRDQVDAQIKALEDRGIGEYILYATGGTYLLE